MIKSFPRSTTSSGSKLTAKSTLWSKILYIDLILFMIKFKFQRGAAVSNFSLKVYIFYIFLKGEQDFEHIYFCSKGEFVKYSERIRII